MTHRHDIVYSRGRPRRRSMDKRRQAAAELSSACPPALRPVVRLSPTQSPPRVDSRSIIRSMGPARPGPRPAPLFAPSCPPSPPRSMPTRLSIDSQGPHIIRSVNFSCFFQSPTDFFLDVNGWRLAVRPMHAIPICSHQFIGKFSQRSLIVRENVCVDFLLAFSRSINKNKLTQKIYEDVWNWKFITHIFGSI